MVAQTRHQRWKRWELLQFGTKFESRSKRISLLEMIWVISRAGEYGKTNQVFSFRPDFKISNMITDLNYGGGYLD